MMSLPRVKFLTVVWGKSYIERFCSLSLPSFVSSGNLPALASATELEVVIMTCRADRGFFEGSPAFELLERTCPVRFVDIDDLVFRTGVYGVTLTLAYARPIIACGQAMVDTHFVFMNADFVLADGSLRSLIKPIKEGRGIILGPSFRAISEDVEPLLEARVDKKRGVLSIPCREMVAMSLPHPHLTTVAKMRNQAVFHSVQPNQFFWKLDDETILGRYFLIFMLCLKPEQVVKTINTYCDYGFIPEMCPSGDEIAMGDSDEFFMLELQERDKESHLLQLGGQTTTDIAASLSSWTTLEHRRAALHDIVFHAGNLPKELPHFRSEADQFIKDLGSHLGSAQSHVFHKFWVPGVQSWTEQRIIWATPPELEPVPVTASARRKKWRSDLECFMYHSGSVTDFEFMKRSLSSLCQGGGSVLVAGSPSPLIWMVLRKMAEQHSVRIVPFWACGESTDLQSTAHRHDKCLVCDDLDSPGELSKSLKSVITHASPAADLLLILRPCNSDVSYSELTSLIESFKAVENLTVRSIGGRLFWRCKKHARAILRRVAGSRSRLKWLLLLPKLFHYLLEIFFLYFISGQGKKTAGIASRAICISVSMRLGKVADENRPKAA